MFCRYEKTKIPSATTANSVTSDPGTVRVAANVSMPRASSLGTSRLSPLPAIVRPTMAATSGRYGVRSAVSLGPAGREGGFPPPAAAALGSDTSRLVSHTTSRPVITLRDVVQVGEPSALGVERARHLPALPTSNKQDTLFHAKYRSQARRGRARAGIRGCRPHQGH